MKEILPGLFIGDEADAQSLFDGRNFTEAGKGWAIIHACKEPYHRAALGYTGRAASKDHPEYLVARRPRRLILNMVDAKETRFFSRDLFDAALDFIEANAGGKVLVHCNQGISRSPAIGLIAYAQKQAEAENELFPSRFEDAMAYYIEHAYPAFVPGDGIRGFLKQNWLDLVPGLGHG